VAIRILLVSCRSLGSTVGTVALSRKAWVEPSEVEALLVDAAEERLNHSIVPLIGCA